MSVLNPADDNNICGDEIEHYPIDDYIDSAFANELAHLESYNKHLYRPNTYLHKWWARRCGTTFRLLLKNLVLDRESRDFYSSGGLDGKIVLDPMMGGGTTLHEAIRLGANVIGFDIDPIPVLQAKASLSNVQFSQLENAFTTFFNTLKSKLVPFFQVHCPDCAALVSMKYLLYGIKKWCDCGSAIIVDSFVLRRYGNGKRLAICPYCQEVVGTKCGCIEQSQRLSTPIIEKRTKQCRQCRETYREDYSAPFFLRYVPLVVCGFCDIHGEFYVSVRNEDLQLIGQADSLRAGLSFGSDFLVPDGPKSEDLKKRGILSYEDLFSSRQILYLSHAIEVLKNFTGISRLYLALLVSTSLEFNSMLSGYKGNSRKRAGAIRHAFSHHAYSFPYTALENNPVFDLPASGTLQRIFRDRVKKAKDWAGAPRERKLNSQHSSFVVIEKEVDYGQETTESNELLTGSRKYWIRQGSATSMPLPSNSVHYIVTDPPYYDSVQYSDLSLFFRTWLKKLVVGSEEVEEIDWKYVTNDLEATFRTGQDNQYTMTLVHIFLECSRVLCPNSGRLIFSYHHWNPDGWIALVTALKSAGFFLINRYVVHSENPTSVHINNLNALTDDTVLILTPTKEVAKKRWDPVTKIDTTSSASFCRDCGSLVGWQLDQRAPDSLINETWHQLVRR